MNKIVKWVPLIDVFWPCGWCYDEGIDRTGVWDGIDDYGFTNSYCTAHMVERAKEDIANG